MSYLSLQVRESIGVTLSVLCSNLRLHASFNHNNLHENGDTVTDEELETGNWDKILSERASELVVTIQNANLSDNLENHSDTNTVSVGSDGNSQDDVQWMETVVILELFLIKIQWSINL